MRLFPRIGLGLLLAACGPSSMNTGDDLNPAPDADTRPATTIEGTVYAPGNAPGQVPTGQEIAISGAHVWLTFDRPADIPQGVYCDQCDTGNPAEVYSDAKGHFVLPAPVGQNWLIIQKGQFRLDQQVTVDANQMITLPPDATTLPSIHDPANGKFRPHIALAEGLWDDIEAIMGKMGIGKVDEYGEFVGTSAVGNFDLYENGSGQYGDYAIGDLNSLIHDVNKMKTYHIIFVPCSDGDNTELFTNPQLRENIREYVRSGGKFYVTDWSAEWEDSVYPEFVKFVSDHDTTNMNGPFSEGDGFPGYTSEHAKAMDPDLTAWLDGQTGPLVGGGWGDYRVGTIDAEDFAVEGNWDHIDSLGNVQVGIGPDGLPAYETPHAWVMGDWEDGAGPTHPLTVTFEPAGCGRILYSTYHTADDIHVGLVPQERVLLYLIMEIQECKRGPIIN